MQYSKKLEDPKWIEFRKKVYSRDGYSCSFNCGWSKDSGIPLVAHHRLYYMENNKKVEPWEYDLDDLITLCDTCHNILHIELGFDMPIYDKHTLKLINEDEPSRRTRLAIEKMKRKEKSNA